MRPTAIVSDDGLTVDTTRINDWDTATAVAQNISSAGSGATWALGDICNHLAEVRKADPRKRIRTLRAFAASINQPYETLRIAARTARYVPPATRRTYPTLTYGHFREIVRKGYTDLDAITQWADRATTGAWGVGALKDNLYGMTADTSDARKLVRRINNSAPGLYEESLVGVAHADLELLRDNTLRIHELTKTFLETAAAERRGIQPRAAAVQPMVWDSAGESRDGGPSVTPRAVPE